MRILNYGSLNIDRVFSVELIAQAGQTISSDGITTNPGGKGLNQSLALARAGAQVFHAGLIGTDGLFLRELLQSDGVNCEYLTTRDGNTGSAFIQVEKSGQNCIVLDGGTNMLHTPALCDSVLEHFGCNDWLLLQNEVNCLAYLIDRAYERRLRIVLNPSPFNEAILHCSLSKVSLFLMNEDEGRQLTGEVAPEAILSRMQQRYPDAAVVLTLGGAGSCYRKGSTTLRQKAFRVKAVDTTAAGDTFTGYFLAALTAGRPVELCLREAALASAIAVTRSGAAPSIPYACELAALADCE